MNVPSVQFLAFAALVAILINLSQKATWRRAVLLVANVAFFATFAHTVHRLAPFLALLVLGFACVKTMEARKDRVAFAVLLVGLLCTFFWLKEYAFVPHQLFLPFVYATVGMSYVFFRILALVIDAYQDATTAPVDVVSYVNYTLNFTTLVSGPIQLYADYCRTEGEAPAALDATIAWRAIERIILGFFKVAIVSPLLGRAQDLIVARLGPNLPMFDRVEEAVALLVLFPMFLYVNFSGYCDVAIATARFLRLSVPENFSRPFSAHGFIEFWSRWHITLSHWLKTYVYSPLFLTLMRRFPARSAEPWFGVGAYFVTFFIIGLWHGQTSNFAFFGALLGLGVSVNKVYQILLTRRLGRAAYAALIARPLHASLSRAVTFVWFAFSLLWFWSTWPELGTFVSRLGVAPIVCAVALAIVTAAPLLSALEALRERARGIRLFGDPLVSSPYLRTALASTLFVFVVSVEVLLRAPAPHIVYRGF